VPSLRAVEDQSAPIPGEITRELGRIIYVFTPGPADVRSLLDGLDPIQRSGVMLIRLRCRTGTKYPIQGEGFNGPAQDIPGCVMRTESQTSASYVDQPIYN